MNIKPVLAVDFDDVVAGYNHAYHRWHNKNFGTTFKYKDLKSFDMCSLYGINPETLAHRTRTFAHQHHHRIRPVIGASEALDLLSSKYEIHLVTSRCESLHEITVGWIESNQTQYFHDYHFTNGFNTVFPHKRRKKIEVCREIGAIALVDDADSNALEVAQGGLPVCMPMRPWNGQASHELIFRLRGWKKMTRFLMSLT